MIDRHIALGIILFCCIMSVASGEAAEKREPAHEDRCVTCSIHLATDPTVRNLQGEITLNNRPKDFVVEFSEAMDHASAERAFWRNMTFDITGGTPKPPDPATSHTLGLTLNWENDHRLRVGIARPQGRIVLFFDGAQSKDRQRRIARQQWSEMLAFNVGKPQTLKRYDFQGKLIKQYPIESEILNFHSVREGFALAGRPRNFDEDMGEPLLLLELAGDRLVKYPILDLVFPTFHQEGEPQWDPAGQGFYVRSGIELTVYSIQDVQAGRPGHVLYRTPPVSVKNWNILVGFSPSPDGQRIALLQAHKIPGGDSLKLCPLTLLLLDRAGRILDTMDLPFAAAVSLYYSYPVDVQWLSGTELLVCPQLGRDGMGHVHHIDLGSHNVKEISVEPLAGPLPDRRWIFTTRLPAGNTEVSVTDLASGKSDMFSLAWKLGRALPAGVDKYIFCEDVPFAYSLAGRAAPHLTLRIQDPHNPVRDFPARGALAGADETSIWLAVEE